jgi:hypothetical protein
MPPHRVLAAVPVIPADERPAGGNIVSALGMLGELPGFAEVVGLIDVEGDLDALIAELAELFARLYLANAHDLRTAIAFIHGVTSVMALANIAPEIGEGTVRAALPYAWQAGCGLYACFGGAAPVADAAAPAGVDPDELIERAVAHGDEHVIKFTEACLHRHRLSAAPACLAAAAHVSGIIPRR